MAGERVAERPQGGQQFGARPCVRRQQQFIDRHRLGVDDEVVVLLVVVLLVDVEVDVDVVVGIGLSVVVGPPVVVVVDSGGT